jgi:hypothetical protein
LVEEVKDKSGVGITNEDVFMATTFGDFLVSMLSNFFLCRRRKTKLMMFFYWLVFTVLSEICSQGKKLTP